MRSTKRNHRSSSFNPPPEEEKGKGAVVPNILPILYENSFRAGVCRQHDHFPERNSISLFVCVTFRAIGKWKNERARDDISVQNRKRDRRMKI